MEAAGPAEANAAAPPAEPVLPRQAAPAPQSPPGGGAARLVPQLFDSFSAAQEGESSLGSGCAGAVSALRRNEAPLSPPAPCPGTPRR